MDCLRGLSDLYVEEVETRSRTTKNMWSFLRNKDYQVLQRSRSKWLKKDEINSGYFNASVKSRSRRNTTIT